jgi:hypothetical protein
MIVTESFATSAHVYIGQCLFCCVGDTIIGAFISCVLGWFLFDVYFLGNLIWGIWQ